MSYSCSYHCFDAKTADLKWQAEDTAKLRAYDDGDLMELDLDLGSTFTVSLNGDESSCIEAIMDAHDIQFDGYITLQNISDLLSNLDTKKVRSVIYDSKSSHYEPEIRENFDSILSAIQAFLNNDDPEDTKYSIEGLEKYMVPFFEAQGIMLYSSVTKKQLLDFDKNFSNEIYEKAVNNLLYAYEKAINENSKHALGDLLSNLSDFKKMVLLLKENPQYELMFLDDGTDFPETLQKRLVMIKAKFVN